MSTIQITRLVLGEWGTNCYILVCDGQSFVIDPAADAERILAAAAGTAVKAILVTHGHPDHVEALGPVREAIAAPVGIHPADAAKYGITGDFNLRDGDVLSLGSSQVRVVYTPGHTPGSVCFRFDRRAIVGDTLFPGGPGHSKTPEALAQILSGLRDKIFAWPDDLVFYPGHGESETIGAVRPAFQRFMSQPRPPELCGDVEWGLA